jgi:outer membrane biosynthesis protein TonB
MSLALHVVISLIGMFRFPYRSSSSMEAISVGISFVDQITESPAPLGTLKGDEEGTLLGVAPETPVGEETPEPVPEPAPEPALEPVPEPVPEPTPVPEPVPESVPGSIPESSPPTEEQKTPPQTEPQKPPEPPKEKSLEKLDALMKEEAFSSEDFLRVLKNVETTKKKRLLKKGKTSSSIEKGKTGGKLRKGIASGALEGVLSAGEEESIRQQIYPHWSVPGGITGAENLVVELRITLQEDGTVTNIQILDQARCQTDPQYRAAAESARRAVRIASPLKIPANRVDLLRSFRFRFNLKDALE